MGQGHEGDDKNIPSIKKLFPSIDPSIYLTWERIMRKKTKYSIYQKTLSIYRSIHLSNLGEDHEGDDGEAAAVEHDPHVQLAPPRPVSRPVDPRPRIGCLDERKVGRPRLEREEGGWE